MTKTQKKQAKEVMLWALLGTRKAKDKNSYDKQTVRIIAGGE